MHKLDRSGVIAPDCLSAYDYKTQTWDDFGRGECKKILRAALVEMQGIPGVTTADDAAEYGVRCAYCEGLIHHKGHIEHFRRKNRHRPDGYPELTFDWDNLFLACGSDEHCGHYKDRKEAHSYDPDELIKPDEHDPEHYLFFHSSGEVRIRDRLDDSNDIQRAKQTIRVFGLDNRTLAAARARAVSKYKESCLADLEELSSWDEANRQAYLQQEIEMTRWEPYATTIKHFLQHI